MNVFINVTLSYCVWSVFLVAPHNPAFPHIYLGVKMGLQSVGVVKHKIYKNVSASALFLTWFSESNPGDCPLLIVDHEAKV